MKSHSLVLSSLLGITLLGTGLPIQADDTESYAQTVGRKIGSGLANITTSSAEIPKNIIIINNQSNVIYGVIGGTFKGMLNMAARIGVGALDLASAPIPSRPIVQPLYVWEHFDRETTYGPAFRSEQ